ncbi:LysM peptidoglycan-binding domain-containing protein [Cyanobium sp. Maggiore-St4-Cus]|uniref:LysM peptidoglycan-binding domain-containing protein n=1 Tax=Cyanobium sp. Maggiore-St4-Cus TaxID=2823717 RepID=UPI0020CF8F42|nr:LysM peptidoglycan-binding domain-containing protein [Cyanobium sp. Maggiore-St4-Cus]MCP9787460.1 LysM peptidoglycan-binding domain-containing protein [Cyanobium sp. Maggiore-St4-Cus]
MLTNIPPPLLGVELPSVVAALDPVVIHKASVDALITALPAPSIDKIYVRVRLPISIEELSSYLKLDEERLAKLNDVNEDHHFRQGDWLVIPSQLSRQVRQIAQIDTSELRRTPPLQFLAPVEERATVRFGDTVVKIAQRYGLTLQELLRLNPGLETARLVVGSTVRLSERTRPQPAIEMPPATPPVPLAESLRLDPAALPSRPPAPFDASLDELVRDGVLSPVERARISSGSGMNPSVSAHQQACDVGALSQQECNSGLVVRWRGLQNTVSGPTVKPLSPNEQALLQRIRSNSYTPQWRTYGQCKYDWAGWRLNSNGTRTTAAECGGSATRLTVGVSCDRLLVAGYTTASGWSKWREPAGPGNKSRQGEDEMVAALCANV